MSTTSSPLQVDYSEDDDSSPRPAKAAKPAAPTVARPARPAPATADDDTELVSDRPAPASELLARLPRPKASTIVALALAVAAFVFLTRAPGSSDAPNASSAAPAEGVAAQVAAAQQFHAANGTFRGFTPPAPYLAATGTDTLVVATIGSDECTYGGVTDAGATPAAADPSGAACTEASVRAAQEAIDAAEAEDPVTAAAPVEVSPEANAALSSAASTLAMYASMGMSTGAGPFGGAETMPLFDAKVVAVAPDGSNVTVQVLDGTGCATAVVSPGGAMTPPAAAPCR